MPSRLLRPWLTSKSGWACVGAVVAVACSSPYGETIEGRPCDSEGREACSEEAGNPRAICEDRHWHIIENCAPNECRARTSEWAWGGTGALETACVAPGAKAPWETGSSSDAGSLPDTSAGPKDTAGSDTATAAPKCPQTCGPSTHCDPFVGLCVPDCGWCLKGEVCAEGTCVTPCEAGCATDEYCKVTMAGQSGCSPVPCEAPTEWAWTLQLTGLQIGTGCDLDGDTTPDNALGALLAQKYPWAQSVTYVDGSHEEHAAYVLAAQSTPTEGSATDVAWLTGWTNESSCTTEPGKAGCKLQVLKTNSFLLDQSGGGPCLLRTVVPGVVSKGAAMTAQVDVPGFLPLFGFDRVQVPVRLRALEIAADPTKGPGAVSGQICATVDRGDLLRTLVVYGGPQGFSTAYAWIGQADIDEDGKGVCIGSSLAGTSCKSNATCGSGGTCLIQEALSFSLAFTAEPAPIAGYSP